MVDVALGKDEFFDDLQNVRLEKVVSKWLVERHPYLFTEDRDGYLEWKHELGAGLGIDPRAIAIVGSAAVGFSLNPNKNYRAFGEDSDIDVVAVSDYHFDVAWEWMRSLGSERHKLPAKAKASLEDHRSRLVYFGSIASDRILEHMPFAKSWVPALSNASGKTPVDGREVNVRLYRDFRALRSYTVRSFRTLRDDLLKAPEKGGDAKLP